MPQHIIRNAKALLWAAIAWCGLAAAQEASPGNSVDSLLDYARQHNPEYAGSRLEAEAAGERIAPAGALPDPRFRMELRDITKMSTQDPTLSPSRVGNTRYILMQDLPWFGKRDLKRDIAELEAHGAVGRSQGTWAELAARIKTAYAQLYYVHRNLELNREILDLMVRLEKIAQVRYAGGLNPQQDAIRAQVEQTALRTELVALETEAHHLHSRLNWYLARPATTPLAEPERLRPLPPPAKLDYTALAERARTHNPMLSAQSHDLQAAEKNRDLVYKNRYPDFNLAIAPIQFENAIKDWELMLEMNIPLQQGSRRAQERESEAKLSAARARSEAIANQILAELAESLAGFEAARRTEALATGSLLPQAELTYQAALAGYETGKVDFATLLDAQRQIRQARQNQIKAQAEAQARLADIERILGEDL